MTLRVALSGAGQITPFHLRAWHSVGARVIAVADPNLPLAQARAAEFGIERHYPDLDMLLASETPDALDVASPRSAHVPQVIAAASRGIAVLCQKPLAPTLAEAEALVGAIDGQTRLMVHENWRFRPYYRQIAAWLNQGLLGEITGCTLTVHNSGLIPDAAGVLPSLSRQPFFRDEPRLLVAETLIHHLDVVRWLLGPLRVRAAHLRRTSRKVSGETAATVMLETQTGLCAVVQGNLTCGGLPPRTTDRFELTGTLASVLLERDTLHLLGKMPQQIAYTHDAAYQACFDATMAHFVACLQDGTAFETAPEDNLETLRLVEEAYRLGG